MAVHRMSYLPATAPSGCPVPRPEEGRPLSPRTLSPRRIWRSVAIAGAAVVVGAVAIAVAPSALAADNPFQKGPDPTLASIQATRGTFATSTTTVAKSATNGGFGGGTIYFPTDTSQGTFAAFVIAPGFTERQSAISWLGPRLASFGFVVFTIDTNSTTDQPTSRATQLLAAADFLTNSSSVKAEVDKTRVGVSGHSMGGGGTLEAAVRRTSLKAAVPMDPWDQTKSFTGDTVPTLIIAAQNDNIAPVAQHAKPFYNSIPTSTKKMYVELAGAGHNVTNSANTTQAQFEVAFLKRFLDNDTRYTQFLCGISAPSNVSLFQNTCPF
jgi:dienelactone hydrolase